MAKKNKWSEKVRNIKITESDMESLAALAESPFFPLLIRTATKMSALWKDQSFKLDETDPQFILKHQRFVERAIGIRMLLKFVEEVARKMNKEV